MSEEIRVWVSVTLIVVTLVVYVVHARVSHLKAWRRSVAVGWWVRFYAPCSRWMDDDLLQGEVVKIEGDTLIVKVEGIEYRVNRKEVRP